MERNGPAAREEGRESRPVRHRWAEAFSLAVVGHALALCVAAWLAARELSVSASPLFRKGESSMLFTIVAVEPAPPQAAAVPPPEAQPAPRAPTPAEPAPADATAEELPDAVPPEPPADDAVLALETHPPEPVPPPAEPVPAPAPSRGEDAVAPEVAPGPAEEPPQGDALEKGVETVELSTADVRPVYPLSARLRGEEGTVRVLVLIGVSGRAEQVEISQSSGCEALDRAAADAVRKARFFARSGFAAGPRRILLTFRFQLVDAT
jgi:protein TonB